MGSTILEINKLQIYATTMYYLFCCKNMEGCIEMTEKHKDVSFVIGQTHLPP